MKVVFDELYYRDRQGKTWIGENIQPGIEASLNSIDPNKFDNWYTDRVEKSGKAIAALSEAVRTRRGYFYGWSTHAEPLARNTIESVVWHSTEAMVSGPIGRSGAGAGGSR